MLWLVFFSGCGARSVHEGRGSPGPEAGPRDAGADAATPSSCVPTDPDEVLSDDPHTYACGDSSDCMAGGCCGEVCAAVPLFSPCNCTPRDLGSCGCFEGECRWLICEPCPDEDMDGHAAQFCGGDDCDDADPTVHPRWRKTRIDVGDSPALDATWNHVAIAFLGAGDHAGSLELATEDGGDWVVETLQRFWDSGAPVLTIGQIAYVADSEVRIGWLDVGGVWNVQPVEPVDAVTCVDATTSFEGWTELAYAARGELRLATGFPTSSWSIESIGIDPGGCPTIAVDGRSRPCISHRAPDGDIVVTRPADDGETWTTDVLATGAPSSSRPDVAADFERCSVLYDVPARGLFVSSAETGKWTETRIDEGGATYESSIALRRSTTDVAFSRSDAAGETTLFYATDATGEWTVETIASQARSPSIALEWSGAPHVAYVDTTAGEPTVWHAVRVCEGP